MRNIGEQRECSVADRRVRRGNGLEMIVGRKFPGDIVVRLDAILRILLRREKVHGVVAIGLIKTNYKCTGGGFAILQFHGRGGAADFDVLFLKTRNEFRDPQGIALIFWNDKSVGWFFHAFAIGMDALVVKIAEEFAR